MAPEARRRGLLSSVGRSALFLIAVCALAAMPACHPTGGPGRTTLTVRGGPLLRDVFPRVVVEFGKQHPEVEIRSDFSCPPCVLTDRMSEGVDLDVFVSAGDVERDILAKAGLLDPSTTEVVGSTRLVLAVPPGNPANVRALGDLHRPEVKRIAVGDPEQTSPGRYARQAFKNMGLWDEVQGKLSVNKTGCEVLRSVALGQAEAGLLYGFCLHGESGEPILVEELPDKLHDPITLSITAAPGREGPAMSAFFAFMATPDAQAILRRAGIGPPRAAEKEAS
jgi:molybdate transport system substrate-binding protein